jgi:prepilin-type N-terminal cleavage/methylation domain-containing protein
MKRRAFTLIELILALSLIVVATAMIGSLMQLYARNFATRGEDIRRMQLARSVLNMIAEDLRSVVTKQEYDPSVLQQQLGGGGGGGGGAGMPAAMDSGSASTVGSVEGTSSMLGALRDPGLYGSQYELMLDVSRVPRVDEYIPQGGAMLSPTLTDVPGDIKTVSYFVQTPGTMGVQDTMDLFKDGTEAIAGPSGLVRRQLDRAILAYAEEVGDSTRLQQTGDLIAPEVVSLEFAYYDGIQWLYEWDSSTQALPHLITITLAIQSASGEEKAALEAGVSLSTLTLEQKQSYGIETYELTVAIPGAQLRAADAASADAAAGMGSMGL